MSTKQFRPLLARPHVAGEPLPRGMYASPKLDGIRCLIINGVPTSRSLKPLPNRHLREYLNTSWIEGYDGELIVGDPRARDALNKTTTALMSHDAPLDGLVYYAFDRHDMSDEPYWLRHRALRNNAGFMSQSATADRIVVHETVLLDAGEVMSRYEAECVEKGYEGIMLRDPSGLYKYGRTASKGHELLKVKRFEDGEAIILRVEPKMHNANAAEANELGLTKRSSAKAGLVEMDTLGLLWCRDLKTGVEFGIGSMRLDDDARRALWLRRESLPGELAKYRFQPAGVKDAPRFPVLLGLRSRLDMDAAA